MRQFQGSISIWLVVLATAVVLGMLLGYTGRDDSHITYFVADALAKGDGIVNYNGRDLEQSSSLAFTALLAATSTVTGLSAADTGPFVSFIILIAIGLVLLPVFRSLQLPRYGLMAICLLPPVLYWSLSGMENSLYLLTLTFVVLFTLSSEHAPRLPGLIPLFGVAVAAVLTRPEALLVILCFAVGIAILDRGPARNLPILTVLVLAVVAAIGFRLAIGLDIFPNPVHAKQDLGLRQRFFAGMMYFVKTMRQMPATSALLIAASVFCVYKIATGDQKDRKTRAASLFFLLGFVVACFAFTAGGDWMEMGRFLVPVFAFVILSALIFLPAGFTTWVIFATVSLSTAELVFTSRLPSGGLPLWVRADVETTSFRAALADRFNVIHIRDLNFTDEIIKTIENDPQDHLTIASGQAGMVPYYLIQNTHKSIEFVDLLGLTTRHTNECAGQLTAYGSYDIRSLTDTATPDDKLKSLQDCIGAPIDYVFDLDFGNWNLLDALTDAGCEEVFREKLVISDSTWKEPSEHRQFLFRCAL